MPLAEFFADQFRQVRVFMLDSRQVVRVVRVDPDLRPVLLKALVKMDDEPDNPHAMLLADDSFSDPGEYFTALLAQLQANYQQHAVRLTSQGVRFKPPYDDPSTLHPATQFRLYASSLAEALPDTMGSLVFVLAPEELKDGVAFRQSIEFLASQVESRWLKFLVLDSRLEPLLDAIEPRDRVGNQTFYMSPAEIEQKLKDQLAEQPQSDPLERRRALGVLAGFAFSNRNYDEAARLQQEWATLAEADQAHAEAASACYNLANTLLAKGELLDAEDQYLKCCNFCLDHGVQGVLPLALTNLGVSLSRQDRLDEAVESLRAAYQNFKAQNHKPGVAFVFDTLANIYHAQHRDDEAERAWLSALDVYRGITSDALNDLRDAGARDIEGKLERFYAETGRENAMNRQHLPS